MTLSSRELRTERGVSEELIAWRAWRRSMALTIPEAAAMAGVSEPWLERLETGKERTTRPGTLIKLHALMERWSEDMRPKKIERRGGWRKGKRS
jgi:transcriptional regulator with XRE-family HTH domain